MTSFSTRIAASFVLIVVATTGTTVLAQATQTETPVAASLQSEKAEAKPEATASPANESTSAHNRPDPESYRQSPASITPKPDPDDWQFHFTPYLWVVGVSGRAGLGDVTVDVESGITDSNVKVNFGFMAAFEARKNRWIIITDFLYANLGTERPRPTAPIFTNATADFKTFILDPEVGYRVAQNQEKGRFLDVVGGIRYWHLKSEVSLLSTSTLIPSRFATMSVDWVDVIGGVRGGAHLTSRFFLLGRADVGGGGSQLTYKLFGGVGYQVSKTFSLLGGYRDLKVDYDNDNFLFDMALHGPIFGLGIKF